MVKIEEIRLAISKFLEEEKIAYRLDDFLEKIVELILKDPEKSNPLRFGTHSSKHIHSSSKGDSVNFKAQTPLPENILGSQSLPQAEYDEAFDAFRPAGDAKYAKFFYLKIDENRELRHLILADEPVLKEIFSNNQLEIFKTALNAETENPKTDERNKQVLWYCPETEDYQVLIPLYPVGLSHSLYSKVWEWESKNNKDIRDAEKKSLPYPEPYAEIIELAYTKIGGANPQNVSQLCIKQSGKHFLLPSFPPEFKTQRIHFSRYGHTFFCNQLLYGTAKISELFQEVVKSDVNNKQIREKRQEALDLLIAKSLALAEIYRGQNPNWTNSYSLKDSAEIYWLDPKNDKFSNNIPQEWQKIVSRNFASWLIFWFKKNFPKEQDFFNDQEYDEFYKNFYKSLSLGGTL